MAIRSFKNSKTEKLFAGEFVKSLNGIKEVAVRKLIVLDSAVSLKSLAIPPGNNLEALKGDRKGQHSIRINDQFRLCFVWTSAGPDEVEIVDYH